MNLKYYNRWRIGNKIRKSFQILGPVEKKNKNKTCHHTVCWFLVKQDYLQRYNCRSHHIGNLFHKIP